MDTQILSDNIAKYARWCIIELSCSSEIRRSCCQTSNVVVSKFGDIAQKCGSIDQTVVDFSIELISSEKFRRHWNQIRAMPESKKTRDEEDEYYEKLDKLFNLFIECYGLHEIANLHGDNYVEFSDKFFEFIDFDNNIQHELK